MTALEGWARALREWAIPEEILASAPESPWGFSPDVFRRLAEAALQRPPTPSNLRALEVLPEGGTVLDIGCGAGASSLPLGSRASLIVGVDPSDEMLEAFRELASRVGADVEAAQGSWPNAAPKVDPADVVVCHHVLYNVAELRPFVEALTDRARGRVVVELTREHPRAWLNDLWMRFHGLARPERPTADDAETALRELGLTVSREDWAVPAAPGSTREEVLGRVRRFLCLSADQDRQLAQALGDRLWERDGKWAAGPPDQPVTTLWWDSLQRAGK